MNPLYNQIFNQQYVNPDYLQQLQQQHHNQQQQEIAKAVKALHDYCDAARKITPEYRQQAFCVCAAAKGIQTIVGTGKSKVRNIKERN